MRRRILWALVLVLITMFLVPLTAAARKPVTPIIVATLDFVNQTGPIAPIVLDTPTADTTYRVSIYSDLASTPGGTGQLCPKLTWTDEYGSRSIIPGGGALGNSSNQMLTVVVRVKANTDLTVAVISEAPSCGIPSAYGLFVVAEVIDAP